MSFRSFVAIARGALTICSNPSMGPEMVSFFLCGQERVLPPHSPAQPGHPLLSEWVLLPSSPAERRLSALQPRRLACRRSGSSGRPARHHPLQLQRLCYSSYPVRDCYKVLGVEQDAAAEEIKRVYRKLAKESHPDLHPSDKKAEARFKEVSEAYGVLGDPQAKEEYDRLRFGGHPTYGVREKPINVEIFVSQAMEN